LLPEGLAFAVPLRFNFRLDLPEGLTLLMAAPVILEYFRPMV
jgi:hypothetical protein